MRIPAHFAHIRQRDTPARLLTPITDVSTRKMTAIYRFRIRDERTADLGCRHLPQWPTRPHSDCYYACPCHAAAFALCGATVSNSTGSPFYRRFYFWFQNVHVSSFCVLVSR